MLRQILLDTETTGLSAKAGHRIIEIGCVELINRELTGHHFHCYINPQRQVDFGAQAIHGITNDFLSDKPLFDDIVNDFLTYINQDELIIHNAAFDLGFLNTELKRLPQDYSIIEDEHKIIDTLALARAEFVGKKNTLDALCKRYNIDNSQRTLHGALLDAEILAEVYLAMTQQQIDLTLGKKNNLMQKNKVGSKASDQDELLIIYASKDEEIAHEQYLNKIKSK